MTRRGADVGARMILLEGEKKAKAVSDKVKPPAMNRYPAPKHDSSEDGAYYAEELAGGFDHMVNK